MNNITEYKILSANTAAELSSMVNEMIKDGWFPAGGISISQTPTANEGGLVSFESMCYQSMIK